MDSSIEPTPWWALWLARRSLRTLHLFGAWAGWLTWLIAPAYRRRFGDNANRAGVSRAQRRRAVAEAGRTVLELPRLWLRPVGQPIANPVHWEGAERIDAALGRPGGLIFMTPHLGGFEVAAQAYADRYGQRQPMTVLYRPARKAALRALSQAARARPGLQTAPASLAGVRQLVRALQSGQTVGLLPDQVPPEGLGMWAPFFGHPAYTMTLGARLARQTGATLLLAWCERLPRGQGYVIRVTEPAQALPPLASAPGHHEAPAGVTDPGEAWLEAAVLAINRSMEALIAGCPSQYLWGYHRYKAPRRLR